MEHISIISKKKLNAMLEENENAFEWLGEREYEGFLYSVWENRQSGKKYATRVIRTVHMGFNSNEDGKVEELCNIVEREGGCNASWGVTGRTMHEMLARKLARELPQYEFKIDYQSYGCLVQKRKGDCYGH